MWRSLGADSKGWMKTHRESLRAKLFFGLFVVAGKLLGERLNGLPHLRCAVTAGHSPAPA